MSEWRLSSRSWVRVHASTEESGAVLFPWIPAPLFLSSSLRLASYREPYSSQYLRLFLSISDSIVLRGVECGVGQSCYWLQFCFTGRCAIASVAVSDDGAVRAAERDRRT